MTRIPAYANTCGRVKEGHHMEIRGTAYRIRYRDERSKKVRRNSCLNYPTWCGIRTSANHRNDTGDSDQ